MRLFGRKLKKLKAIEQKDVEATIRTELTPYMTREELQEYLANIKNDERKKRLWDSLSIKKKIKLLRYMAEKKGGKDGKK